MTRGKYDNTLATVPTATHPSGYVAADKILRRGCGAKYKLAERLLGLVGMSGLQGAPALEFFAECLLWNLAGSESVPMPRKLKHNDIEHIRARARELSISLLADAEPFTALLSCERLGLDAFDHRPVA